MGRARDRILPRGVVGTRDLVDYDQTEVLCGQGRSVMTKTCRVVRRGYWAHVVNARDMIVSSWVTDSAARRACRLLNAATRKSAEAGER